MAPKQDVLGFLAKFQFRGDEVDKPVTVLSGGERARLSVATLIREGVNLLLLDEPTNHMDIPSMEAMEDTILAFSGAVVLVTHDRYLLGRVAESLLRIHEGRAEFREGGYEDNQAWVDLDVGHEPLEAEEPEPAPAPERPAQVKGAGKGRPGPAPGKGEAEGPAPKAQPIDRDKQKTIRRWERKVQEAEAGVTGLEQQLGALAKELAAQDPADWQAFGAKLDRQKALETELAYAMAEWEAAQTALEKAQAG
jgi:ABC-type multidrug transport system ATPase subunit